LGNPPHNGKPNLWRDFRYQSRKDAVEWGGAKRGSLIMPAFCNDPPSLGQTGIVRRRGKVRDLCGIMVRIPGQGVSSEGGAHMHGFLLNKQRKKERRERKKKGAVAQRCTGRGGKGRIRWRKNLPRRQTGKNLCRKIPGLYGTSVVLRRGGTIVKAPGRGKKIKSETHKFAGFSGLILGTTQIPGFDRCVVKKKREKKKSSFVSGPSIEACRPPAGADHPAIRLVVKGEVMDVETSGRSQRSHLFTRDGFGRSLGTKKREKKEEGTILTG